MLKFLNIFFTWKFSKFSKFSVLVKHKYQTPQLLIIGKSLLPMITRVLMKSTYKEKKRFIKSNSDWFRIYYLKTLNFECRLFIFSRSSSLLLMFRRFSHDDVAQGPYMLLTNQENETLFSVMQTRFFFYYYLHKFLLKR